MENFSFSPNEAVSPYTRNECQHQSGSYKLSYVLHRRYQNFVVLLWKCYFIHASSKPKLHLLRQWLLAKKGIKDGLNMWGINLERSSLFSNWMIVDSRHIGMVENMKTTNMTQEVCSLFKKKKNPWGHLGVAVI